MPMPNRNIQDANGYRYAYQGQEKDPETGKEAFELRLWDGRIGRWLTTDPAKQYHSPYMAMGNNPISSIDPDGGHSDDDYLLKSDGTFEFLRKRNGPDRLYVEGMNNYYTINDKNLLPELESTQNFGIAIAFSKNESDINKIFIAGAHFTNKEFEKGTLKNGYSYVGTSRDAGHSFSLQDLGVKIGDVLEITHSHPGDLIKIAGKSNLGRGYTKWEAEQISMGYKYKVDPITKKGFEGFNRPANNSDAAVSSLYRSYGFKGNYYIYMPQTSNLWRANGYNYQYIRNIHFNYHRLNF